MKKFLIVAILSVPALFFYSYKFSETEALSLGEPVNSSVEAAATLADSGTYNFTIKIGLKDGIALNVDAPWKLTIKAHEGLTLDKTESVAKDFDPKLPGFKFQSTDKPTATKGKVDFTLVAFICTKDKTRCFREVHDGSINWGS
jgi:hypothetical protein